MAGAFGLALVLGLVLGAFGLVWADGAADWGWVSVLALAEGFGLALRAGLGVSGFAAAAFF